MPGKASRLFLAFTDVKRQHASFLLGMKVAGRGDKERNWTLAHNSLHAPTCPGVRIFDCRLMDDPPLADQTAQQHGICTVLVGLKLVGFEHDQNRVGQRAVVVDERQRAATREVVHVIWPNQIQSAGCRERFARAAGAFHNRVDRLVQHPARGRDIAQLDQFGFIDDAHFLNLMNHSVHQVGRFRQLTYPWPQFCPEGGLFLEQSWGCRHRGLQPRARPEIAQLQPALAISPHVFANARLPPKPSPNVLTIAATTRSLNMALPPLQISSWSKF